MGRSGQHLGTDELNVFILNFIVDDLAVNVMWGLVVWKYEAMLTGWTIIMRSHWDNFHETMPSPMMTGVHQWTSYWHVFFPTESVMFHDKGFVCPSGRTWSKQSNAPWREATPNEFSFVYQRALPFHFLRTKSVHIVSICAVKKWVHHCASEYRANCTSQTIQMCVELVYYLTFTLRCVKWKSCAKCHERLTGTLD